jgi:ppGpp synthetase/RelA/SpoT-type nucleotidyltranferase
MLITDERAWLEDQVVRYKALKPSYERYAGFLSEVLRKAAGRTAPFAIVQARAKGIASFAEKALRKKATRSDPATMFTDLCGARMIARTRTEVDALCRFVEANFEIDRQNSDDASARLKPAEFGYRSIHYIVTPRSDIDYGVETPADILGLKAEIQIRTMAEHAYSDFAHDLTYKGAFPLPLAWRRELAGAAATLEEVDSIFSRVEEGLRQYASSYGRYLTEAQARREIEMLTIVLEQVPGDGDIADRVARLALALGEWQQIVTLASGFVAANPEASPKPLLRDLGTALCKLNGDRRDSDEYRTGQRYLELATESDDVDAICSFAGTWKGLDDERARELYRRAFELDPANPYALGNYLELELAHNAALLESVRPLLRGALDRCTRHINAGINLPWALFDLGRFHLLLDEPYEALSAYCQAVSTSTAAFMVETSLASLERLAASLGDRPGVDWVRKLLLLGLAGRFESAAALEQVKSLASPDLKPFREPVVIVAGGTDPRLEDRLRSYATLMSEAFSGFEGTILSGGTAQGVSGIVGDVAHASGGRIQAIGYLPETMPDNAVPHPAYELRRGPGSGFSAQEPLQNWIDLVASGVSAADVRVLGINGGRIAAAEYRIALAMGAAVGLVAESGREAGRLLGDDRWSSSRLLKLPEDREALRSFVEPTPPPEPKRELLGRSIHERSLSERSDRPDVDPSLAAWDKLPADFRNSNTAQADHMAAKLRRVSCVIAPADSPGKPVEFTPQEIEALAEMEHGRWTVERLLAGWVWDEKRDPALRHSPYLVAWSELPDNIKEVDRRSVRRIPALLGEIGLSIRREEDL